MRRRNLLAKLAVTAAAVASSRIPVRGAEPGEATLGDALVAGLRDAMLGLSGTPAALPPEQAPAELAHALSDFHACHYGSLTLRLPRLLRALLAAERQAPEETHARPAVRSLTSGLLTSGSTTLELRGLSARSGVLI
ncbi:hypothetical protein [Streptosporangium sandarakinum]|uniref:hypothetical protein n=1 Tax=Streptosporangium sandarakinum TaxID=1260955 RepID=UPI0037128728